MDVRTGQEILRSAPGAVQQSAEVEEFIAAPDGIRRELEARTPGPQRSAGTDG
ncbi:hypothetical protein [Kitasatospora sp. NPDC096204]|uniref:hypothetical protein n=1 Tax=Kitasatospora sp. NPDC096204 TaxID=3364094 RepID=UPI00381F8254